MEPLLPQSQTGVRIIELLQLEETLSIIESSHNLMKLQH